MQDWSEGYTTDVAYTYGYYSELNPLRSRLALLEAGLAYPEVRTACELGFGQGVSVNMHAAASGAEWHATDFNPSQAGFAKELAGDGAFAGRLHDEAFEAFCRRQDLPDFDFIGLHGIWSWISEENRHVIADFIKRKLKVGGVLYISYNTQPGWSAIAPIRDLLTGYDEVMSAPGTAKPQRIDAALDFADRLLAGGAQYGSANPLVAPHVKALRSQNRNYLVHEYFNRDWMPMPFSRMAEWMESVKLQFAGSAHFLDHVPALNLTPSQQQMLVEIPDQCFRESVRDFMVNQRFRRDYWVRGARRLTISEQNERIREQRVVLIVPRAQVALKVNGALGRASMHEDVYLPILEVLADHQVYTLGEIEKRIAHHGISVAQVFQAVLVMCGTGAIAPAQERHMINAATPAARDLNARLCHRARHGGDTINHLASPVTGGAIATARFDQLFLLARGTGLQAPGEWACFVSELVSSQGQRIVREDGKPVETTAEQLEELTTQAVMLQQERLPILQALGAVS